MSGMVSLLHTDRAFFESRFSKDDHEHFLPQIKHTWLKNRYIDCLWLGETHSPLSSFLGSIACLYRDAGDAHAAINALRALLLSRPEIQARFAEKDNGTGLCNRATLASLARSSIDSASQQLLLPAHSEYECKAIAAALRSGPGRIVSIELMTKCKEEVVGRFAKLWLNAIETRELQLQLLVIMCLLHYNVTAPASRGPGTAAVAAEVSYEKRNTTDPTRTEEMDGDAGKRSADESPTQARKRKRKVDTPHRLTGKGSVFPWQLQGRDKGRMVVVPPPSVIEMKSGSLDTSALARQFESLVDSLCLRIATTSTSVEALVDRDGRVRTPSKAAVMTCQAESPRKMNIKDDQAQISTIVPPFGSQGRIKEGESDDRDVLQWFCCQIIEANFSRSLPRQCGIIRSRCFVPAIATPIKKARTTHSQFRSKPNASKPVNVRESNDACTMKQANQNGDILQRAALKTIRRASVTPESGPLQKSLLKEDRQTFQRTQSIAAAKRRTTLDAREVNVRRRWERSISLGPRVKSEPDDFTATQSFRIPSQANVKLVESAEHGLPIPSSSMLVPDTPAKPKQINILQPRQRPAVRRYNDVGGTSMVGGHTTTWPTPWHRVESQPLPQDTEQSLNRSTPTSEFDEAEEMLDESLHAAFNADISDEDEEEMIDDVFRTYRDWLGPAAPKEDISVETMGEPQKQQGEEEASERVVLAKQVRSLSPSLFRPLALNDIRSSVSSFALTCNSDNARGISPVIAADCQDPIRKIPTGRNPFAVSR